MTAAALVVGAGGGIGAAAVQRFADENSVQRIYSVQRSRDRVAESGPSAKTSSHPDSRAGIHHMTYDPDDAGIRNCVRQIADDLEAQAAELHYVVIATGILHSDDFMPEKRIEDLGAASWAHVMQVNSLLPLQWLQALTPLMSRADACSVAVLSARVGSISDNRLGGWYSYRASKAALNMMLKTLAIEYRRRAKGIKLIAFHPGTTDTALSRPFQENVPVGKLFDPAFVAERLFGVLESAHPDGELSFLDWDEKRVGW